MRLAVEIIVDVPDDLEASAQDVENYVQEIISNKSDIQNLNFYPYRLLNRAELSINQLTLISP